MLWVLRLVLHACEKWQGELLGALLRVMEGHFQTGSEGQRKLTLGNATILAYCLRWPEFRVGPLCQPVGRAPDP